MSIGLPAHLAPSAVRRSFATAQHALALTLMSIAVTMVMVFQVAEPTSNLWLSSVALLPAISLLIVVDRVGAALWSTLYLLAGGLGVYFYALGMLSHTLPVRYSEGFTFLAVKIALIMVGGVVLGLRAGVAGAVVGYLTAELAVGLAQIQEGIPLIFDVPAFVILLATVASIALIGINSAQQRWAFPRLQRAARDEHLATLRYAVEVHAATLMHDTVLNHLAAIADSSGEEIDQGIKEQIRQDVDSLMGEEWLSESTASVERNTRGNWQQSGLFTAIQESRLLGLNIESTGDLASVTKLDRHASLALGLAVKQCLINVLKHSGVRDAEVAVYHSHSEVSVMVIDNGCGFDEAATGADRLGLRSSVRKRIEIVGGNVHVWSTPGRGAAVMITVPMASSAAAPTLTGAVGDS